MKATGYEVEAFNAKGLNCCNALYETSAEGKPFLIRNEEIMLSMPEEAYRQNVALFR